MTLNPPGQLRSWRRNRLEEEQKTRTVLPAVFDFPNLAVCHWRHQEPFREKAQGAFSAACCLGTSLSSSEAHLRRRIVDLPMQISKSIGALTPVEND